VFIMSMIIILIASKYLTFGLVLALVVLSVWAVWPLLKAIGYMVSAPELMGHRTRALGAVAGLGLLLVIALGLVPARASAYAAGTVEPVVEAPVRTGEDGFLTTVVVGAGQAVTKDQPLFVLESPENRAELARAEARLKKAQAEFDRAITGSPAEEEVSRLAVERARAERDRAAERAAALTVRSPAAGVMVPPTSALEPENLAGRYFARGVMLGTVVSPDDLVVRVLVSDKEAAYLFHRMQDAHHDPDHPEAYVRVRGGGGTSVPARIVRIVPAGSRDMAKSSLSTATGGDITPDPDDTSGRKSLVPQFVIEVKAEDGAHADRTTARWVPGLRARVRFALPREPLFDQWWRKASQYLQGRLG
jgi:putative peptide zinc metalloprotease protein